MRVLVSAYCCHPRSGSEQGFAWWWIGRCALEHDVVVITPSEQREAVELHRHELGDNVRFEYVPAGGPVSASGSEHPGERIRQYRWQLRAIRTARKVNHTYHPDVAQHISTGSWRQPSCLAFTDVPLVMGPLAGSERFPAGFVTILEGNERRKERIRELLIRVARFDPLVRFTIRRARVIITTGPASRELFDSICPTKRVTGTRAFRHPLVDYSNVPLERRSAPLTLAWMGRLIPRKGFDLLIDALVDPRLKEIEVEVIGGMPDNSAYPEIVRSKGLEHRLHFHGSQPKDRAFALVAQSDVFVFTSLQDMMGQTLSEAMQLGRPCVVMDWSGPAELAGDTGARLVPVSNPQLTAAALADVLADLAADPGHLANMARAARQRIETLIDEQSSDEQRERNFLRAISNHRRRRG